MDKYDEQIAYLTQHPEQINNFWGAGLGIFSILETTNTVGSGCLTMIRNSPSWHSAYIGERALIDFSRKISLDERIPRTLDEITVEDLPVFAEWQREYDKLQNSREVYFSFEEKQKAIAKKAIKQTKEEGHATS